MDREGYGSELSRGVHEDCCREPVVQEVTSLKGALPAAEWIAPAAVAGTAEVAPVE